jgi:predicted NAD-dependent protein-ADP-ribosyltransferase YbiA (DUF1768 family)
VCKGEGHQPGDTDCPHYTKPASNIIPFAGHSNCLSNFFLCEIKVFVITHCSAGLAYQYVKAIRSGDIPRVSAIQTAKTALDAKKLGDTILLSESFTSNKVDLMTENIEAKSNQVPNSVMRFSTRRKHQSLLCYDPVCL